MSFSSSVTIGPAFFQKAFNDYSNRYWAFAREILQNSIDCGSTEVDIWVIEDVLAGTTVASVSNDGEPMSSDTLTGKLLSLGESGKDFRGSVGGFGKAKEILYFAHKAYTIVTGGIMVEGSGAGYNLGLAPVPCAGTLSVVTWDGSHLDTLKAHFRRFIELCGTGSKVRFRLNGEAVRPAIAPGTLNRTLDRDGSPWAEVRLASGQPNLLVVRIGGVPMFHRRIEYKGTVVVDLLGTSGQRLTANRDGLIWAYSDQLNEFVTAIAVDKKTAFKLEKAEYTRYRGAKLRLPEDQARLAKVAAELDQLEAKLEPAPKGGAGILVDVLAQAEAPNPLGHAFIVKNTVRKAVPAEYEPASFGDHAKWLVKAWAGCLVELHAIYQFKGEFAVGFVFSEDVEAEYETSTEDGTVYYLNPCLVTKKGHRRRFTKADRSRVLAIAAHEFAHGLGYSYHDENYATTLTGVMAAVMKHHRKFNKHLR